MKMNLAYIASAVGGKLSKTADAERIVNGFFLDSRTPSKDKLFLALVGERVDGNTFVPDLVKNGCCAILDNAEYMPEYGSCILVDDVRESLQKLARFYRENELKDTPVVGITGSVGKTTTKDMVALALSSCLSVHKTIGNSNSQIGLPQTVLATDPSVDCAIFELGMSMKGEMERISRCAMPDISIVTNIGYSHLENLGSREAIRDEKLKIAKFSKKDSILLLNGDEPLLRGIDKSDKKVYYISVEDNHNSDCFAYDITETENGVKFKASVFGKEYTVEIPAKGKHFVINSLFALATASLLGCDVEKCATSLSNYESDGRRQFVYEKDGHTVISDCYNAAPDSMKASLSVLGSYKKGRRIAVLGDMLELGKDTVLLHKEVGESVKEFADVLITYGELAENIAISANLPQTYVFKPDEKEKLKEFLQTFIKENDTVLYKASNGMKLSDVIV
ncbi:MAG: UDP-N-acetylmuramoyl-tripeptide--D-alanyl-D-alanine ligase [Clostridia bacterium]|nr:UDP-N-acetylmuramoyl-tripeptide--D-alanyl-D-alanine ligase [Clostridia bacterium]